MTQKVNPDDLYRPADDVAREIACSPAAIAREVEAQRMRGYHDGRRWMLHVEEIPPLKAAVRYEREVLSRSWLAGAIFTVPPGTDLEEAQARARAERGIL